MKILVMGGTRLLGEATVRQLLADGHDLTVFNRGSQQPAWADQVRQVRGDRDRADDLAQLSGLDLDLAIDFSGYRREQTAGLLQALPGDTAIIYCSSGSVYAPTPQLPWPETTATGPWSLWGEYAQHKLASEGLLRAETNRPVTIFRLPYVLGPRNYAPREEFVLNRLLDGAAIAIPGDGKAVQQFITADQVGQSVARLLPTATSTSQTFNLADPLALCSTEGFVQLCAELLNVEPEIVAVPGPTGVPGPFNAANCVFPFPNEPYLLDLHRAAAAQVLPDPRPLTEALANALAVLQAEPGRRSWQRTDAERQVLGSRA
jgi:nucleoside-diphosphate-sugar epimerase